MGRGLLAETGQKKASKVYNIILTPHHLPCSGPDCLSCGSCFEREHGNKCAHIHSQVNALWDIGEVVPFLHVTTKGGYF